MSDENSLKKSSRFVNRYDAGPFDIELFRKHYKPPSTNLAGAMVPMIGISILVSIALKLAQ